MGRDDHQTSGWAFYVQMFFNRLFYPSGRWDEVETMFEHVSDMRERHGDDAITAALGEREGRRK